jgi:hypothetical protein
LAGFLLSAVIGEALASAAAGFISFALCFFLGRAFGGRYHVGSFGISFFGHERR